MKLNEIRFSDLQELDFNDAGSWPLAVRVALFLILAALVGGMSYQFLIKDQIAALDEARAQEAELRGKFERKQRKVATLDALKEQVKQLKRDFASLRGQLPSRTEVANLLQEVSQTRVITGLEEELFQPESEQPKDFYAELPIKLRVIGDYHQFGEFVSGIASLPRIVTLHNIRIRPRDGKLLGPRPLVMDATARTYRYRDDEEPSDEADAEGATP